jgi:hypothetical protein
MAWARIWVTAVTAIKRHQATWHPGTRQSYVTCRHKGSRRVSLPLRCTIEAYALLAAASVVSSSDEMAGCGSLVIVQMQ